jgi:pilus assembly protein FimV
MARKRKLAAAVFSLGCLHASALMALGLGDLKLESFLNEPLKASVDLLNIGDLHEEQIRIRLATSEDFDKLGLDRAYFLTTLQFEVVTDEAGGTRIIVSSDKPVLEPYLDFIVEARWPSGRLLREYTILIDPPVYTQETVVVSASQRVEETEGIPAPEAAATPAKKNKKAGLFNPEASVETDESSVETSGTRVAVQESSLASGAMPQRDYNASTSSSGAAGSRYMISRDDTLWEIAERAKPAGTSVHQEMLDIQRLNPSAFINGNINRIKAGYIIYLPTADDVSSTDLPAALAEVQEQNAAWREGRDAELYASSGPSLRISAEPEAETDTTVSPEATATGTDEPVAGAEASAGSGTADSDELSRDGMEAQERLVAAEEQLETLKRIVSLKDDQIAALQSALVDAGVEPAEEPGVETLTEQEVAESLEDGQELQGDPVIAEEISEGVISSLEDDGLVVAVEEVVAPEELIEEPSIQEAAPVAAEVEEKVATQPAPPVAAKEESWTSYLLYIIGALVLGVVGFIVARRRGSEAEDATSAGNNEPAADVFSDVKLKQQSIEVEAPEVEEEPSEELPTSSARDNRGYGERKHDEYASDIDSSDALAEADIYIAYGRHPQAVELLNNALGAEPSNPVYRLKLLEIYHELNDQGAATEQLNHIRASGDSDSIARAESIISSVAAPADETVVVAPVEPDEPVTETRGLSPNPLEMMSDPGESLESDFSGLEIEKPSSGDVEDDLDLSSDFAADEVDGAEDEELVIADDSNGLSTKLDLARAYLDMGDDDGARQILDEVVAEGSDDLKAEARALLGRIGG